MRKRIIVLVAVLGLALVSATTTAQGDVTPQRHAQLSFAGAPYWPGWDIVRGVALQHNGPGGYVLDGWGGLHAFGGAPPLPVGRYAGGFDWAHGLALRGDDAGGFVVDSISDTYDFGTQDTFTLVCDYSWVWGVPIRGVAYDPAPLMFGSFPNYDTNGADIDGWGGIHRLCGSEQIFTAGAPYWPGWDIARGIAITPGGNGGFVLDGWGGVHAFGGARVTFTSGYWPGWDIARGIAIDGRGNGVVVDGWGGLHPFGYQALVAP